MLGLSLAGDGWVLSGGDFGSFNIICSLFLLHFLINAGRCSDLCTDVTAVE